MKSRMILLLAIGACLSMTSVAKNDYRPPGKEQLVVVDAPKMEINLSVYAPEFTFVNYVTPYLTESVSEALPVSATVCPAVTQKVADVELHDFGNFVSSGCATLNYRSYIQSILYEKVLFDPNWYVMRC